MDVAAPAATTPRPPAVAEYVGPLKGAITELAYVRGARIESPAQHDLALMHLGRTGASIHEALAGALKLPDDIPGGAVSFARDAAAMVRDAGDEVMRGIDGLAMDVALVHDRAESAIGRLQQAVRLAVSPPSTNVYDGS